MIISGLYIEKPLQLRDNTCHIAGGSVWERRRERGDSLVFLGAFQGPDIISCVYANVLDCVHLCHCPAKTNRAVIRRKMMAYRDSTMEEEPNEG